MKRPAPKNYQAPPVADRTTCVQFQQTAAALTQLYRDQAGREGLAWQPFQAAAGSLTLLYRDSLEELRLAADINRCAALQMSNIVRYLLIEV